MHTVGGEFVGGDIIPEETGLGSFGQHVAQHVVELPMGMGDVLTSVQERDEAGADVLMLTAVLLLLDEGVGLQHGLESLPCVARLVSSPRELFEMAGDLP